MTAHQAAVAVPQSDVASQDPNRGAHIVRLPASDLRHVQRTVGHTTRTTQDHTGLQPTSAPPTNAQRSNTDGDGHNDVTNALAQGPRHPANDHEATTIPVVMARPIGQDIRTSVPAQAPSANHQQGMVARGTDDACVEADGCPCTASHNDGATHTQLGTQQLEAHHTSAPVQAQAHTGNTDMTNGSSTPPRVRWAVPLVSDTAPMTPRTSNDRTNSVHDPMGQQRSRRSDNRSDNGLSYQASPPPPLPCTPAPAHATTHCEHASMLPRTQHPHPHTAHMPASACPLARTPHPPTPDQGEQPASSMAVLHNPLSSGSQRNSDWTATR